MSFMCDQCVTAMVYTFIIAIQFYSIMYVYW